MAQDQTADAFMAQLRTHQSDEELRKIQRYFKAGEGDYGAGDVFIGVKMGTLFKVSEGYLAMPVEELEKLLEDEVHEARAGALSIMGKAATAKGCSAQRLKDLYGLYLRRHDRINNWDLVDLAAWRVVGRYLWDRPRDVLYRLARSDSLWERRTAILATLHFALKGDHDDSYAIAEILLDDPHDLTHKAVGWALRTCDKDRPRLEAFLEKHGATMARTTLRAALEHFELERRAYFMGLKVAGGQ
ncbi:MAG: alkylation repair enzyme [Caulobacter sp.]|nr:alkylation repair enzyme [Caulobacter sp.]